MHLAASFVWTVQLQVLLSHHGPWHDGMVQQSMSLDSTSQRLTVVALWRVHHTVAPLTALHRNPEPRLRGRVAGSRWRQLTAVRWQGLCDTVCVASAVEQFSQ